MNILILTPDAVGSTLLQRLITIYCQLQNFSDIYVDIHQLTNGLTRFYSPEFNREILREEPDLASSQSLSDIIKLLNTTDHKVIARMAESSFLRRQDPPLEQANFYKYLNDNFFIIAARRSNVFDWALSECLRVITKRFNVFSPEEKKYLYANLYRNPIEINQESLKLGFRHYENHVRWSEKFFDIGSYFDYSENIANIETYILGLPLFNDHTTKTWMNTFSIDFSAWNTYHLLNSVIPQKEGCVDLLARPNVQDSESENISPGPENHAPSDHELSKLMLSSQLFTADALNFCIDNKKGYSQALETINRMVDLGVLSGHVPIKKLMLSEKCRLIKNFDQCLDTYNNWAKNHTTVCRPINTIELESMITKEMNQWHIPSTPMLSDAPHKQQV